MCCYPAVARTTMQSLVRIIFTRDEGAPGLCGRITFAGVDELESALRALSHNVFQLYAPRQACRIENPRVHGWQWTEGRARVGLREKPGRSMAGFGREIKLWEERKGSGGASMHAIALVERALSDMTGERT
jgi:hypothetical protein